MDCNSVFIFEMRADDCYLISRIMGGTHREEFGQSHGLLISVNHFLCLIRVTFYKIKNNLVGIFFPYFLIIVIGMEKELSTRKIKIFLEVPLIHFIWIISGIEYDILQFYLPMIAINSVMRNKIQPSWVLIAKSESINYLGLKREREMPCKRLKWQFTNKSQNSRRAQFKL